MKPEYRRLFPNVSGQNGHYDCPQAFTVAGADRIYVVKDGQIAESGSSRELMERGGLFARMWQNYQTSIQWKVQKEVQ